MNKENHDINIYSGIRTDLAIEARENFESDEIEGVKTETEKNENYTITHVSILNEKGSKILGKPIGNYITIESPEMREYKITNRTNCK